MKRREGEKDDTGKREKRLDGRNTQSLDNYRVLLTEKAETNRDSAHVAKQTGRRVCKSALILVQAKMSDGLALCRVGTSGSAREARSWTSIVWLLCMEMRKSLFKSKHSRI